jgi:AAA+ ATPase superfamily predicted ATPase
MEKLKELERFITFNRSEQKDVQKDLDALEKFLRRQLNWIEELYAEQVKRINWLLDRSGSTKAWIYWELDGVEFRAGIVGNDWQVQVKVAGVWTQTGPIAKGS